MVRLITLVVLAASLSGCGVIPLAIQLLVLR